MIFVAILTFVFISELPGLPLNDDRIIYPDELDLDKVADEIGDFKVDQRSLFNDPNILKFGNTTEDFLIDEDDHDAKLEYQEHYQGDIILDEDQKELLKSEAKEGEDDEEFEKRTGLIWQGYRWPKNRKGKVRVPFVIANHYTTSQRNAIISAMNYLEKYTCIQFVERVKSKDFIYIYSGNGCHSYLGKIGGKQSLSLKSNGCLSRGTILHELIHALGYDHMQNHADRDSYIYVLWKNIDPAQHHNFKKVDSKKFSNFGTSYDYYSVMHYDKFAFSKNNRVTILPKDSQFKNVIGQRNSISGGDQKRINNMYRC